MFCPQCGQQQANDAARFCSRCGFQMEGVVALVESGGRFDGPATGGRRLTKRQRGIRKGVLIMAGGVAFGFLAVLLTLFKEDLFVFMPVAALVFIVGLMRMLYGLMLEDDAAPRDALQSPASKTTPLAVARARANELPPARAVPASAYAPRADTAEMAEPPSVTDSTTKLL